MCAHTHSSFINGSTQPSINMYNVPYLHNVTWLCLTKPGNPYRSYNINNSRRHCKIRHPQRNKNCVTALKRFLYCHTERQEIEWWLLGAEREVDIAVQWSSFQDGGGWFHHQWKVNATEL